MDLKPLLTGKQKMKRYSNCKLSKKSIGWQASIDIQDHHNKKVAIFSILNS